MLLVILSFCVILKGGLSWSKLWGFGVLGFWPLGFWRTCLFCTNHGRAVALGRHLAAYLPVNAIRAAFKKSENFWFFAAGNASRSLITHDFGSISVWVVAPARTADGCVFWGFDGVRVTLEALWATRHSSLVSGDLLREWQKSVVIPCRKIHR